MGYDCAYPAVTVLDDEALVTYYYGNRADNHGWESVKLKIFSIDWFYKEQRLTRRGHIQEGRWIRGENSHKLLYKMRAARAGVQT